MAGSHALLTGLQAQQAGAHAGQPGGWVPRCLRRNGRICSTSHTSTSPRTSCDSCSVAPDQVNAHDIMCKQIVKLTNRLIASKYFLKELEQLALDWLEDQFTGRAADQWHIVVREAKRTATTSGIGPNSVLYRALSRHAVGVPGSRRQGDYHAAQGH
jgi:hypothetical protein